MILKKKNISSNIIKSFWNSRPLCTQFNPHEPGTDFFFKYYDRERESIESLSFSYNLHEYKNFKNKKVLDVGSGNGYVLSKYAKEGAKVYGVDISENAIKICKKRFKLLKLKGSFKVANAEKLPYPNNYFDCICSMGVLHHVSNIKKALDEIYRVLKPGGKFISMFYHRNSLKYHFRFRLLSLLYGKSLKKLVNEFDGLNNPKGEVFTKSELKKYLHRFNKITMYSGYVDTSDIIIFGSRFFPKRIFEPIGFLFGWNLYAKARKD